MAGGAIIVDSKVCDGSVFQINLTEENVEKSLTYRELRGIKEGLKALRPRVSGGAVRWHYDNWAVYKIVEFGSMKVDCHEVAVRINEVIQRYEVNFEIVLQSREKEEIRSADRMSKDFDFEDYKVRDQDFRELTAWFGRFSATYFALDYFYRMRPFYSCFLSEKSSGSDAFMYEMNF